MSEYIFAFTVGAILLFILIAFLARPLKWVFRILINSVLGCIGLWLFNLIGGIWGIHIGINAITALVVGILGIPGFVLLLIIQAIAR